MCPYGFLPTSTAPNGLRWLMSIILYVIILMLLWYCFYLVEESAPPPPGYRVAGEQKGSETALTPTKRSVLECGLHPSRNYATVSTLSHVRCILSRSFWESRVFYYINASSIFWELSLPTSIFWEVGGSQVWLL